MGKPKHTIRIDNNQYSKIRSEAFKNNMTIGEFIYKKCRSDLTNPFIHIEENSVVLTPEFVCGTARIVNYLEAPDALIDDNFREKFCKEARRLLCLTMKSL